MLFRVKGKRNEGLSAFGFQISFCSGCSLQILASYRHLAISCGFSISIQQPVISCLGTQQGENFRFLGAQRRKRRHKGHEDFSK
jgi:hypothetical protein